MMLAEEEILILQGKDTYFSENNAHSGQKFFNRFFNSSDAVLKFLRIDLSQYLIFSGIYAIQHSSSEIWI